MSGSEADDTLVLVTSDKGQRVRRRLGSAPPLSALITRRGLLLASTGALAACVTPGEVTQAPAFDPEPGPDDAVAPGYSRQVLIAWDTPLWREADSTPARRFGYNNDYLAFFPIAADTGDDEAGLLVVNHEYPIPHLMFAGLSEDSDPNALSEAQILQTMDAVGMSVIEVRRRGDVWRVNQDSRFTRRITARSPIRLSGPAAGHRRLRTSADSTGVWVLGTHDNCNGGMTPWGTFLSGEEGSRDFFGGDIAGLAEEAHLRRSHYAGMAADGAYGWPRVDPRFDVRREPNESNRFEWVVELDPFDPEAAPVKRTALGRFAHEGAHCALCPDGRVAVYLGDDWEFEYCYKFVSRDAFNPNDRTANRDLLDHGVLYVARFVEDGTLDWLPLVFGEGPLTAQNGFYDQGDVLIETRRAADLLGATPMDCPEGYQPHPQTGRVYVVLTGNEARTPDQTDAANPRAGNRFGHLLELAPPQRAGAPDHAALRYSWRVLLLCGAGDTPASGFHPATHSGGKFVGPDNINFDPQGRMWVCSDGPGLRGEDGLWRMALDGPEAGLSQLIYRPPFGAECCGPAFTPGSGSVFVSVQHPGDGAPAGLTARDWPSEAGRPRPAIIVLSTDRAAIG